MPSPWPASSAADRPAVVVAALSARALARAARGAGHRVIAFDLFGDRDTREAAVEARVVAGSLETGFEALALLDAVARVRSDCAGLVYGAGFEDRPQLLDALAGILPLIGNTAGTVRRVKDPRRFFAELRRLGLPYPEVAFEPPAAGTGWLAKRIGGSGGGHIDAAGAAGRCYYQRRVDGRPVGALFLADGRDARLVGLSEQWSAPGQRGARFRYGGAVQPARIPDERRAEIAAAVAALVPAFALRGLNSADFLVRDDACDLLEVNPRPGATLDLFESQDLFARHCAACRGRLRPAGESGSARAAAVVYAPRSLRIPAGFAWPAWAADLPHPGESIARDAPLCSVLAEAPTAAQARDRAMARQGEILGCLLEPVPHESIA